MTVEEFMRLRKGDRVRQIAPGEPVWDVVSDHYRRPRSANDVQLSLVRGARRDRLFILHRGNCGAFEVEYLAPGKQRTPPEVIERLVMHSGRRFSRRGGWPR